MGKKLNFCHKSCLYLQCQIMGGSLSTPSGRVDSYLRFQTELTLPPHPRTVTRCVSSILKFEIYLPIFSHAYQKGHKPSGFIFYCAYQTVFNGCIQYAKWLSLFLLSFIQIKRMTPPRAVYDRVLSRGGMFCILYGYWRLIPRDWIAFRQILLGDMESRLSYERFRGQHAHNFRKDSK